ncbi:MAG TPA: HAMP domain-containing sensor histidine kinase [Gemmatimonadales bacterium]|nr:HAMP domain-containing sensor histidine kinase [Gemmatimonadales bacterium]
MRTSTAERLAWPSAPAPAAVEPAAEPHQLATQLAAPNGLELVVEMAHDLRSPLTSILVLAETLLQQEGGPITEMQRRQLGLIYSAALCLSAAASDVLELTRGGTRLVARDPAPFSVVETLSAVRGMILPLAEEKKLALQLVHPVPERRIGHAQALSRVLLNLATNAVKFTDHGFVEIGARPLGPTRLEFSVRDTGPGLDASALRTLFQPFRKSAVGVRQHFSSAGLGLAICRKLVRAMGSELEVETRPGWGTRFFFALNCPVANALD